MAAKTESKITRKKFVDALNEDLSREYQAIIASVNNKMVKQHGSDAAKRT